MNTMHLFAGGGGGMYADLILGHNPIVAVEWEKAACDVLRARKSEWWPDCEIIEGDIRAFSGVQYAGKVDCIHAGFPCQDLSVAKTDRAGMDGDRSSLYVEALRIFCEVRPRYLFLENVPGIRTANNGEAFNRVMSDLAAIGLDARWLPVSASEVGANHRRKRWWCLATDPECIGRRSGTKETRWQEGNVVERYDRAEPNLLADAQSERHNQGGLSERKSSQVSDVIDGAKNGFGGNWWAVEPEVDRMVNGLAGRRNRVKMLGNGQSPIQAAYAWVMLGGPHNLGGI